ncbi:MAG: heme exporter protein CcmD [Beijerinckiaceae bacterium]|jgi:heme exporter protein CcmD|nr:heme exporter protein CcmD [Beijerinckiaceae bacterium]
MTALGPHAFFIVGSYLASLAVIAALTIWIVADNRARKSELARLDRRQPGADRS